MTEKMTVEQLEEELAKSKERCLSLRDEDYPERKNDPPEETHLWCCGEWLSDRLTEQGVEHSVIMDICYALGQRASAKTLMMRIRDASTEEVNKVFSETTVEVWNRWVEGDVDEPGEKLALQLLKDNSWTDGP